MARTNRTTQAERSAQNSAEHHRERVETAAEASIGAEWLAVVNWVWAAAKRANKRAALIQHLKDKAKEYEGMVPR